MGNYWKGISDEDLIRAEKSLLLRAGLDSQDFQIHDLVLHDDNNEGDQPQQHQPTENYIHYTEIKSHLLNEQPLPKLVLIHGYGAGGCVFFRILKDLSLYFHLYVVDMLGMGGSGRPQFAADSVTVAEDFFVNSLKIWKDKVFGIGEKVYWAGHSLGGYVSAVYALRHPEDIIKLLLLSPVGIPEKPDNFTHEEVAQRFKSFKGRVGARLILKLWENNFTPFGPLRFAGSYGTKFFLNFYVSRRMNSIIHEEELVEIKAYLHQIFLRPASGEYALNTILSPGSWAKSPLVYRLPTLLMPVAFYYGE